MSRQSATKLTVSTNIWHHWRHHQDDWKDCTRCPLHESRKRVCLFRGKLPCDVLFIGEAPGRSEDMSGIPFHGEAGKLLDSIIKDAMGNAFPCSYCHGVADGHDCYGCRGTGVDRSRERPRYAITNIVGCLPPMKDGTVRPPTKQEASACSPRLQEFLVLARPRLIVTLGQTAKRYLDYSLPSGPGKDSYPVSILKPPKVIHLIHPAAILRKGNSPQAGLDYRRCVAALTNAIGEIL